MRKSRNIWNIGINQIAKWAQNKAREGVQSIINALQDPNPDYGYVIVVFMLAIIAEFSVFIWTFLFHVAS